MSFSSSSSRSGGILFNTIATARSSSSACFSCYSAAAARREARTTVDRVALHAREAEAQLVVVVVRAVHREEHRQDEGDGKKYSQISGCDLRQFAIKRTAAAAAAGGHQTAAGAEGRHRPRVRAGLAAASSNTPPFQARCVVVWRVSSLHHNNLSLSRPRKWKNPTESFSSFSSLKSIMWQLWQLEAHMSA
jgi:hypothetical protein